jgi:hypothetical protein
MFTNLLYFPSLKDWTENQYGKVKHFRFIGHVRRYTDIYMKKFVKNAAHCNSSLNNIRDKVLAIN